MEQRPAPPPVSAEDRRQRQEQLRALLEQHRSLAAQHSVIKRELGTLQWESVSPRTADLSNPEPAAAAVDKKSREVREALQRVDEVQTELVRRGAGPCELANRAPLAVQPQRAISPGSSVTGAPPLKVTIMTEQELERHSGQLRETLVVLCYSAPAAAVTQALAQGAVNVEVRGSPMSVLDATRQYHAGQYAVGVSPTELAPNAEAAEAEEEEEPIDLGNGIAYQPWSSHPFWNGETQGDKTNAADSGGAVGIVGRSLLLASPSVAQGCARATHAKEQILCGWCNLSACVQHIGQWYATPTSSRADLYEMELTELAERNTDVVFLCPNRIQNGSAQNDGDDGKEGQGGSSRPSEAQILAGVLLYQLMQELEAVDVDLGEPSDDVSSAAEPLCVFAPGGAGGRCRNCDRPEGHAWHRAVESDGWTTRTTLSHVMDAVRSTGEEGQFSDGDNADASSSSSGGAGWYALWEAAYEQQRAGLPPQQAVAAAPPPAAGLSKFLSAEFLDPEEVLLATMHVDAWSSAAAATSAKGGDSDGSSGVLPVPVYDKSQRCFRFGIGGSSLMDSDGDRATAAGAGATPAPRL